MEENLVLYPDNLTLVPKSINIDNFIPGRIYKETLMIHNTYNFPVIINIKPSDKSLISLNKPIVKVEPNNFQKITITIQDRTNYSKIKLPLKPKKLFLYLNGQYLEDTYEINLNYFCNTNNDINFFQNNIQSDFPYEYYNRPLNLEESFEQRRKNLIPEKVINEIYIQNNENRQVVELKKQINNLRQAIMDMKNYDNNEYKIGYHGLDIYNNSFGIKSNKNKINYNEDKNLDENIIIPQNKILQAENSVLAERVQLLEKKLEEYEKKQKFYEEKFNENNI